MNSHITPPQISFSGIFSKEAIPLSDPFLLYYSNLYNTVIRYLFRPYLYHILQLQHCVIIESQLCIKAKYFSISMLLLGLCSQ